MTIASTVHWALNVRDATYASKTRSMLARCGAPGYRAMAKAVPAVQARLDGLSSSEQDGLLAALSIVTTHRNVKHNSRTTLGRSLQQVPQLGSNLALSMTADMESLHRILNSAIGRLPSRSTNFIELAELLTFHANLSLRERSELLLNFHAYRPHEYAAHSPHSHRTALA